MIQAIFYTLIFATIIQVIYWMFFAATILRYKSNVQSESKKSKGVSVIICAHNELNNLKNLLPKLYEQKYDKYEIIVVNDRSGDDTYDFLKKESESNSVLKIVEIDRTPNHMDSKKYAIFLGIKAANFEELIFTDADCLPASDDWIRNMVGEFEDDTKFVLGFSQFKKETGFINLFSRFETQMTGMLYSAFALAGNPYMGVGRNMSYKKSTFLENKGFNGFQNITGGDDDLLVNHFADGSNTRVSLGKDSLVWSYSKRTLSEYIRQKVRHISVSKLYQTKDKILLSTYSASHILFWVAFVILASLKYFPEFVFGALVGRIILNSLVVHGTSKKFGERIVVWFVPIMDFVYCIYLIVMGIATISTKKVRWS